MIVLSDGVLDTVSALQERGECVAGGCGYRLSSMERRTRLWVTDMSIYLT
jgi:hypothetical protein